VVVGYSIIPGTRRAHAFRWTNGTGMQDLGTLSGGSDSQARGIDDSGVIVGWSGSSDSLSRAVTWTTGAPVDLGTLAGRSWNGGEANAINGGGGIVGGCEVRNNPNGANPYHAAKWIAGSIEDLDPLGTTTSVAYGVNISGQVVGALYTSSGGTRPFIWPTAVGLQDLGTLGGASGMALGINNRGQVVGSAQNGAGTSRAFLWTLAGGMKDLGSLVGSKQSAALGINNNGWVVGDSDTDNGFHALLWTPTGGMVDLNLITSNVPSGDWLLLATAVNDAGQIVGQTNNGRAFLLEPLY
jgi:probable HAF family extracellular repeat protein